MSSRRLAEEIVTVMSTRRERCCRSFLMPHIGRIMSLPRSCWTTSSVYTAAPGPSSTIPHTRLANHVTRRFRIYRALITLARTATRQTSGLAADNSRTIAEVRTVDSNRDIECPTECLTRQSQRRRERFQNIRLPRAGKTHPEGSGTTETRIPCPSNAT